MDRALAALAREGADFPAERREQLLLVRVLLRERFRPAPLVATLHRAFSQTTGRPSRARAAAERAECPRPESNQRTRFRK